MLGFLKRLAYKWRSRDYHDVDPDLIFLDSKNLPDFDTHQFEGRIERPISRNVFSIFTLIFLFVVITFLFKFGSLQIVHGKEFKNISENNKLKQILIVAPRGTIYSRDGVELAYNEIDSVANDFPMRNYVEKTGSAHLLGFIKYPAKDKYGFYYEEDFLPKDGAELTLNEILMGKNGLKLIEINVLGDVISQNVIEPPVSGEDVTLSVDAGVQEQFYKNISGLASSVGFLGGAGIIMDIHSGEILAMTSFPEYDSNAMTAGSDIEKINQYFNDINNPFLNRGISGLYTPGSIVKPFLAFAALEKGIITPEKEIVSTGQLVVPNPYFPDQPSIFKDWKAHGAVDMRRALAVSSDVYFYQIGGGFGDQKGLGIENIKNFLEMFGFSKKTGFDTEEETGVIPDPEWKRENFDGEIWRVGDTYNTAIGQYGMQITPIQAVVATAALANGGTVITPSFVFTSTSTVIDGNKIKGDPKNLQIVKEGMRLSVLEGTAAGLKMGAVEIAGKTGTAELGARKQFVNSWVIGFFPYENPRFAFATVMERGPVRNLTGATYVMRQLFDWMAVNTPEYFKNE